MGHLFSHRLHFPTCSTRLLDSIPHIQTIFHIQVMVPVCKYCIYKFKIIINSKSAQEQAWLYLLGKCICCKLVVCDQLIVTAFKGLLNAGEEWKLCSQEVFLKPAKFLHSEVRAGIRVSFFCTSILMISRRKPRFFHGVLIIAGSAMVKTSTRLTSNCLEWDWGGEVKRLGNVHTMCKVKEGRQAQLFPT